MGKNPKWGGSADSRVRGSVLLDGSYASEAVGIQTALFAYMRQGRGQKWNKGVAIVVSVYVVLVAREAAGLPKVAFVAPREVAHAGQPTHLTYEVSWSGQPDEYVVYPAEFDPVDWGTIEVEAITAEVRGDKNVIAQRIRVTPAQAGSFAVPGPRIAYKSPEDPATPEASRTPTHPTAPGTPQLSADPYTLRVQPDRTLIWIPGSLGALLLLLALTFTVGVIVRRRARVWRVQSDPFNINLAAIENALRIARERRICGDFYGYYTHLVEASEYLSAVAEELTPPIRARAQEVGFRGLRPTEDMMNGDMQAIERVVANHESMLVQPRSAVARA